MPGAERAARSISRSSAAGECRWGLQHALPTACSILPLKEAIDRRRAAGAADAVGGREWVEPELHLSYVETPVAIAIGVAAGIGGGPRALDRLHDGETAGIAGIERTTAITPGDIEPALGAGTGGGIACRRGERRVHRWRWLRWKLGLKVGNSFAEKHSARAAV